MDLAIIGIIVLIALALLLLGGGLIFFFLKRSKGGAAASQSPQQMGVPPAAYPQGPAGFGAPEAPAWPGAQQQGGAAEGAQQWGAPENPQQWGGAAEGAQQWGAAPESQQQQWGAAPEAPQQWGAPESPQPAAPDWPASASQSTSELPADPFPAPDAGGASADHEAYITTPGTSPNEQLPNPELFLTTPSGGRQTSHMNMQAHLRADDGTVIQLDRLMLRVGRHPECDIVVPTPGASRQHAEFEFRDGGWTVTDLNSGNGTFVNGVRIRTHHLTPGDEVRVDQARFTFGTGA